MAAEIEYSTGDTVGYESVDSTGEGYARGQLFTTVNSFLLDSISLKMYKSADATSSFNVDVVTLIDGEPPLIGTAAYNAAIIASKYGDTDDLGTDTGGAWITVDFSSPATTLDADTQYAIVVWYSNGASKTIYWRADNTGEYAGGRLMVYQADPAAWGEISGTVDAMFKIYAGYVFTPPDAGPTKKRLVAASENALWYENI
ncbi:MAG: hypothetical protein JRE28_10415 [Deltaproteobacteria bacterium]|nr:hypothetical protein [Deltaproteobacteria bacterium]